MASNSDVMCNRQLINVLTSSEVGTRWGRSKPAWTGLCPNVLTFLTVLYIHVHACVACIYIYFFLFIGLGRLGR